MPWSNKNNSIFIRLYLVANAFKRENANNINNLTIPKID